ncbi:hypothetical protein BGX21_005332 [Mortierella sp. AD011]|nr:hypothetical protein BGX20_005591 [Mortierella sp. AD010]KAF9399938.1 hypothetical protein BGX21_005332 [Mortierella sp. AD011]
MAVQKEEIPSMQDPSSGYRSSSCGSNGPSSGLTMRNQPCRDNDDENCSAGLDVNNSNNRHSNLHSSRPRSGDVLFKSGGEYESTARVSKKGFAYHHINTSTATTTATAVATASPGSATKISGGPPQSPSSIRRGGSQNIGKGGSPVQKRRRANLLRVRIERGLMVGMALLAGYRMMTLDYTSVTTTSTTNPACATQEQYSRQPYFQQQQQNRNESIPYLKRSAWALGAVFILLALVHALVLFAHDHQLQFPLHNKNLPLQPLRKRSSRYLNTHVPQAAAAAAVAADSEDDSEDDDALYKEIAAEIQQENLMQSMESSLNGNSNFGCVIEPALGSWQSRFCRSAEIAMPQWRVWGSEAHWYRKGADNGSIFATMLVPIVLAAKFVQTVTDKKFSSTGENGIRTAESVLSNMAFSLIFGVSILVHMLLLKVFDQTGSGPRNRRIGKNGMGGSRTSFLDAILPPPTMIGTSAPSISMSNNSLGAISNGSHSMNPFTSNRQQQQHSISSPSSPSSPSLSATSLPNTSTLRDHHSQQLSQQQILQQQQQQQQEMQDAFIFSGEQLHHPSLLMGSSEAERASDREEIWIIALGFGGAYTCLVTLMARFKMIPGLESTGAGMVMLNQNVFQILMIGFAYFFRRSFTFGELVILAQVVTLLIYETLILNFVTPPPTPAGTVLEHPQFMFLLALVVGMLLIGVMLTPVLMYCRRLAQTPTKGASLANLQKRELKKKISAGIVYTGFVAIVLGVIMPRCERVLGQNPFLWLIEFMLKTRIFSPIPELGQPILSPITDSLTTETSLSIMLSEPKFSLEALMGARIGWSRLGLCTYWILAIACSVAFFYWMNTSTHKRSIMGSLNNRRKYYHALAVVMFIPGYLADEPFMHIAFSVGLAALIFLEYIRYFAVVPFGKEIHLFLVGFLDARDGGPIILSHLYLLVGCATPVWLAEQHVLAGLSGIFALGVGDAMASIIGKRFGKHRWPGTIKTVEGTIAFVVSVMIAAGAVFVGMWLMSFVFGGYSIARSVAAAGSSLSSSMGLGATKAFSPQAQTHSLPPASLLSLSTWSDWSSVTWSVWGVIRYGMAISVSAMLEAVSEQNDNLVIPVVMLSMVWLI